MSHESLSVAPIAYRIPEVATLLSLSRSSAYRLVRSKDLKAIRIGGSVRVLHRDLEAYLQQRIYSGGDHEPTRAG